MKSTGALRAGIYAREFYSYEVGLGRICQTRWQQAEGQIDAIVPYQPSRLKESSPHKATLAVGELCVTFPGNSDSPETLPIELPAGEALREHMHSARRAVLSATYEVAKPQTTLMTIDAEVFDDGGELLKPHNPEAFGNSLHLRLSLWVPDLWRQLKTDESQEVERMLLQGDDQQQVLLPPPTSSPQGIETLAQNLAALANTTGGSIFLGTGRGTEIRGLADDSPATQRLVADLLMRAALQCDPPVRFAPPRFVSVMNHKIVCRVDVPLSGDAVHEVGGKVYRREGKTNAETAGRTRPAHAQDSLSVYLDDMLDSDGSARLRNSPDVAVLNGQNGLDALPIGAYICGLLNSERGRGRVIISLPADEGARSGDASQVEARLEEELRRLHPRPVVSPVLTAQAGNQTLAAVAVQRAGMPITLYGEEAYVWSGTALQKLDPADTYRRFMAGMGYGDAMANAGQVRLEHARLVRAVAPPPDVRQGVRGEMRVVTGRTGEAVPENAQVAYDHQLHADVWQPCLFQRSALTDGYILQLAAPLRYIAMEFDEEGHVVPQESADVEGTLVLALDGVLASGTKVARCEDDDRTGDGRAWLQELPIYKTTYLNVHFRAQLYEMFERRRRASYLDFWAQDVTLDEERLDDVVQTLADNGFRIQRVTGPRATGQAGRTVASVEGLRSHGHRDIRLIAELECDSRPVTRELRYEAQRIDREQTHAGALHVRVGLWGAGDRRVSGSGEPPGDDDAPMTPTPAYYEAAPDEIAQLQIAIHRTLKQRLLHLRTE